MNEGNTVSVKQYGAAGNGLQDDGDAFQAALDSGASTVVIPYGTYKIGETLKIGSDTKISAMLGAVIFMADDACTCVDDFFLTNRDHENGNVNISIDGGVWNGNNKGNPRKGGIFDQQCYTGVMFNFINVKGLSLSNMKLCDSESYFVRLGEVDGFTVNGIEFEAIHLTFNQDGIHLGGYCFNGTIENISASMAGSTNDDMVALNADDEVNRLVNLGMKRGPIRNIRVKNVTAADCHTFVRLLSVHSEIAGVDIDGVTGGCRAFALNMDAARYCRTPLFKDSEEPFGVGNIHDVTIRNLSVHKTVDNKNPLLLIETNTDNLKIINFRRNREQEPPNNIPTFSLGKTKPAVLSLNGTKKTVAHNERIESDEDSFEEIFIKY